MKNIFLVRLFVLFGVLISCTADDPLKIHQRIFTLDSHCDTPLWLIRGNFEINESHDPHATGSKVDFPRMLRGGLDASFFAVFVNQGPRDTAGLNKAFADADRIIDGVTTQLNRFPDVASLAVSPGDGYRLENEHKIAVYLGIENGYALGNKLDNVNYFYQRGIRYITLVHTRNNDIADSSTDPAGPEHNGLSAFGEEVVKRMNETGIMIDVSHASDSAFYDVLRLSKAPVIASHSCSRAICDNPRNLTDEMLRALAKNGGVIQMCILSDYVKKVHQSAQRDSAVAAFRQRHANRSSYSDEKRREVLKEWFQLDIDYPPAMATVSDVVDHIDHIVKTIGIEHVGIGTDFDGGGGVQGCYDVSEMPNITAELLKRGYTQKEIAKIWGGNFMRVFKQVQEIAVK